MSWNFFLSIEVRSIFSIFDLSLIQEYSTYNAQKTWHQILVSLGKLLCVGKFFEEKLIVGFKTPSVIGQRAQAFLYGESLLQDMQVHCVVSARIP